MPDVRCAVRYTPLIFHALRHMLAHRRTQVTAINVLVELSRMLERREGELLLYLRTGKVVAQGRKGCGRHVERQAYLGYCR